jgi:hypothetical protein
MNRVIGLPELIPILDGLADVVAKRLAQDAARSQHRRKRARTPCGQWAAEEMVWPIETGWQIGAGVTGGHGSPKGFRGIVPRGAVGSVSGTRGSRGAGF